MTKKPQIVLEVPLLTYDLGLISYTTFANALEEDIRTSSLQVPSNWKFSIKEALSSRTYESQSDAFELYFGYYLTSPKRVPVAELHFELPYKDKPDDFLLKEIISWINSSKNLQKLGNRFSKEDDCFVGGDDDTLEYAECNKVDDNAEFFISYSTTFLRSAYGKNRYLGELSYSRGLQRQNDVLDFSDESSDEEEEFFENQRWGNQRKLIL
jgi:hypothetical protein